MVGIGYRKDFSQEFLDSEVIKPDFVEVAPENWMGIGGFWKKNFRQVTERYPLFTHGLSLSIGSPDSLDFDFLKQIKSFLNEHNAQVYSEHLSYSQCDNAHLYDLLPIPFTVDAVKHISQRIKRVQDYLERPLVMEIISYYTAIAPELSESEFINAILEESGCQLLLDVNNVYVNGFNHNYNPYRFLDKLNLENVAYIHMAGHEKVSDKLIIDTHGEEIIDPVYELYSYALKKLKKDVPVLLERDFNIPELNLLQNELQKLRDIKSGIHKNKNYASLVENL